MPKTRLAASRTTANASGKISSNVSPLDNRTLKSAVLAARFAELKPTISFSNALILSTMTPISFNSFSFGSPKIFFNKPSSKIITP